uniref:GS beta-grasp domain-containing protein n=1 Tax=Aegilops tauschii subsp. strangulata TaxID=200361 RepID=A0A453IL40_AEGTS
HLISSHHRLPPIAIPSLRVVAAAMASLADLVNLDLSDCTDKIIVEYLWVGGSGIDIRSKARTVNGPITDASQLPKWNYDGSSTGQAPGEDSEVILYPQAIFKDPFRRGDNLLVSRCYYFLSSLFLSNFLCTIDAGCHKVGKVRCRWAWSLKKTTGKHCFLGTFTF